MVFLGRILGNVSLGLELAGEVGTGATDAYLHCLDPYKQVAVNYLQPLCSNSHLLQERVVGM